MKAEDALQRALDGANVIIHLGAGKSRELPAYVGAARDRIVLVEANPKTARLLQAQSDNHANVSVLQRAVAGRAGESSLYVYNLQERSSLRRATGLLEYYPGLRLIEVIPVAAHTAGALLAEVGVGNAETACLILDTPGEELAILEELVRDEMLERISSLVLHCPERPMYEGAGSRQDVVKLLDAHGFEVLDEIVEDDFEPLLTLRLNLWKLESSQLQKRLTAAEGDLRNLRMQLSNETTKLRNVISQKDVALEALAKQEKQQEEEVERLQAANREMKASNSEVGHILEQHRKDLADSKVHADELEKERNELRAEVDRLKAVCKERETRLRNYESEHSELTNRQKLLDMEVARAEGQIGLLRDVLLVDRKI